MKKIKTSTEEFEKAAAGRDSEPFVFRLYVTGMSPKSARTIANVKRFCEENLEGRYELKVIDICQQPGVAKGEQVFATPTLIRKLPLPLRKLIGDMSEMKSFFVGINLKSKHE